MCRSFILAMFIVAFTCNISAAAETKHRIEITHDNCIKVNSTTAGMLECSSFAYRQWDHELQTVYSDLMSKLNEEGKKSLREAQRAWIKFRDTEFKWLDTFYSKVDGTMWLVIHASDRGAIVKARVMQLKGMLDTAEYYSK